MKKDGYMLIRPDLIWLEAEVLPEVRNKPILREESASTRFEALSMEQNPYDVRCVEFAVVRWKLEKFPSDDIR